MRKSKKLLLVLMLLLAIPYLSYTQETDSVTISKEFYNIIGTCPVYLNECEELRKLDSVKLLISDNEINNLTYENLKLKNNVNRLKGNVIKYSAVSFAVGIIATIFVMR